MASANVVAMAQQGRIPIEKRGIPLNLLEEWFEDRKGDPAEDLEAFVARAVKPYYATSVAEAPEFRDKLGEPKVFLNHSWKTPVADTFAGISATFEHNGWNKELPIFICAFVLDQNRVKEELGSDFMNGPFIRTMNLKPYFLTFVGKFGYLFTRGFVVLEELYAVELRLDIILVTQFGPLGSPEVPPASYLSLRDAVSKFDITKIECSKDDDKKQLLDIFENRFGNPEKVREQITRRYRDGWKKGESYFYAHDRFLSPAKVDWQHCKVLGRGSFATVYKASYGGNSQCAVKTIPLASQDPTELETQKRNAIEEVTIMQDIAHPNILTCYGLYIKKDEQDPSSEKEVHLVLEYCRESLAEFLFKENSLPLEELPCISILLDIGAGLQALHDRKIVHRDIKPDNIFGSQRGGQVWKLGDFGIAESIGTLGKMKSYISYTPSYCAPELLTAKEDSNVRRNVSADMYSYACVMYDVLRRKPQWEKKTVTHEIVAYFGREECQQTFRTKIDRMTVRRCRSDDAIVFLESPRVHSDLMRIENFYCRSWHIASLMKICGKWNASERLTAHMCCVTLQDIKKNASVEREANQSEREEIELSENEELNSQIPSFGEGIATQFVRTPPSQCSCWGFLMTRLGLVYDTTAEYDEHARIIAARQDRIARDCQTKLLNEVKELRDKNAKLRSQGLEDNARKQILEEMLREQRKARLANETQNCIDLSLSSRLHTLVEEKNNTGFGPRRDSLPAGSFESFFPSKRQGLLSEPSPMVGPRHIGLGCSVEVPACRASPYPFAPRSPSGNFASISRTSSDREDLCCTPTRGLSASSFGMLASSPPTPRDDQVRVLLANSFTNSSFVFNSLPSRDHQMGSDRLPSPGHSMLFSEPLNSFTNSSDMFTLPLLTSRDHQVGTGSVLFSANRDGQGPLNLPSGSAPSHGASMLFPTSTDVEGPLNSFTNSSGAPLLTPVSASRDVQGPLNSLHRDRQVGSGSAPSHEHSMLFPTSTDVQGPLNSFTNSSDMFTTPLLTSRDHQGGSVSAASQCEQLATPMKTSQSSQVARRHHKVAKKPPTVKREAPPNNRKPGSIPARLAQSDFAPGNPMGLAASLSWAPAPADTNLPCTPTSGEPMGLATSLSWAPPAAVSTLPCAPSPFARRPAKVLSVEEAQRIFNKQ